MNYRHFVAAKGDWKRGQKANLQKGDFFRHPKNATAFSVTPTPNISGCRPKHISAPSGKGHLLRSIGGLLHTVVNIFTTLEIGLTLGPTIFASRHSLSLSSWVCRCSWQKRRWLACGFLALGQHSIYCKQTDWVSYPFGSFNSINTY